MSTSIQLLLYNHCYLSIKRPLTCLAPLFFYQGVLRILTFIVSKLVLIFLYGEVYSDL
jgi:hypothetical protein